MIEKLSERFVYPYEEPQIGKVELWDFSRANESEEARKEAVCLVASISYGNEYCKDPNKLWGLLIERGHESPFEFVRDSWIVHDIFRKSPIQTYLKNLRESSLEVEYNEYVKPGNNLQYFSTFKLKVPVFVARQIMRHRSFSYLEMSRRYVRGSKVEFEFWSPQDYRIIKSKLPNGKEVSYSTFDLAELEYNIAVKSGIKPEQARAFLPLGLYTQFWMQGDYKAWLNFFIHRLAPEAQEETRLVAQAMWRLLKESQPEIVETMKRYLNEWEKDCNPIFTSARKKKAEWFRKEFLNG